MEEATNRAIFESTMLPHLDAAYNLARWLTSNSRDAEDIVQEAFLRAMRYFHAFNGGDGRAWMLTIVRNTCLTWHQRQKAESVVFDERTHSPDAAQSSPEHDLLRKAGITSLRSCMEALPLEYREVLVMREMEELSYKEIADVAALPIGTVMSRLCRARKRLEECMMAKAGKV
jgi:RNA polymerase sigma factor (sigma-70 family)